MYEVVMTPAADSRLQAAPVEVREVMAELVNLMARQEGVERADIVLSYSYINPCVHIVWIESDSSGKTEWIVCTVEGAGHTKGFILLMAGERTIILT